jgi:hypothetical protein
MEGFGLTRTSTTYEFDVTRADALVPEQVNGWGAFYYRIRPTRAVVTVVDGEPVSVDLSGPRQSRAVMTRGCATFDLTDPRTGVPPVVSRLLEFMAENVTPVP